MGTTGSRALHIDIIDKLRDSKEKFENFNRQEVSNAEEQIKNKLQIKLDELIVELNISNLSDDFSEYKNVVPSLLNVPFRMILMENLTDLFLLYMVYERSLTNDKSLFAHTSEDHNFRISVIDSAKNLLTKKDISERAIEFRLFIDELHGSLNMAPMRPFDGEYHNISFNSLNPFESIIRDSMISYRRVYESTSNERGNNPGHSGIYPLKFLVVSELVYNVGILPRLKEFFTTIKRLGIEKSIVIENSQEIRAINEKVRKNQEALAAKIAGEEKIKTLEAALEKLKNEMQTLKNELPSLRNLPGKIDDVKSLLSADIKNNSARLMSKLIDTEKIFSGLVSNLNKSIYDVQTQITEMKSSDDSNIHGIELERLQNSVHDIKGSIIDLRTNFRNINRDLSDFRTTNRGPGWAQTLLTSGAILLTGVGIGYSAYLSSNKSRRKSTSLKNRTSAANRASAANRTSLKNRSTKTRTSAKIRRAIRLDRAIHGPIYF